MAHQLQRRPRMLLRSVILTLICLCSFQTGAAQTSPIPFQLRDGFIWIQVQTTASKQPLQFILDTGASVSVIDSGTAIQLGVKLGRAVDVQGVHAPLTGHWPTRLKARARGTVLARDFLALDLSALSGQCSTRVDGLIGADFFENRIVQIDFENSLVRILDSAPKAQASVELQTRPCGLRAPLSINGRPEQWMRLDTGCVSPIQWVAPDVNPAECQGSRIAIGLAPVSIAEMETNVRLGAFEFSGVTTGVHQKPIFAGESGLIGLGLLREFTSITLDSPAKRLILAR